MGERTRRGFESPLARVGFFYFRRRVSPRPYCHRRLSLTNKRLPASPALLMLWLGGVVHATADEIVSLVQRPRQLWSVAAANCSIYPSRGVGPRSWQHAVARGHLRQGLREDRREVRNDDVRRWSPGVGEEGEGFLEPRDGCLRRQSEPCRTARASPLPRPPSDHAEGTSSRVHALRALDHPAGK